MTCRFIKILASDDGQTNYFLGDTAVDERQWRKMKKTARSIRGQKCNQAGSVEDPREAPRKRAAKRKRSRPRWSPHPSTFAVTVEHRRKAEHATLP